MNGQEGNADISTLTFPEIGSGSHSYGTNCPESNSTSVDAIVDEVEVGWEADGLGSSLESTEVTVYAAGSGGEVAKIESRGIDGEGTTEDSVSFNPVIVGRIEVSNYPGTLAGEFFDTHISWNVLGFK